MKNKYTASSALGFLMRATSILISACLLAAALVSPASATHFRYGQISWTQAGGNAVNVTLQMASRRSFFALFDCVDISTGVPTVGAGCTGGGLPSVGDIVAPFENFMWGDSNSTTVYLKVTSIDPANDWLFGVALDPGSFPAEVTTLPHTYAGSPADYLAFFERCCRINITATGAVHQNNFDGGFSVETLINAGGSNNSPVTALPPIVLCPIGGVCGFFVPGADSDGDTLSYRLSTSAEAKGLPQGGAPDAFVQPGPPDAPNAASINSSTGLYTWDTTGAAGVIGDLYSTQVTIEDGDSKIAVDFLIELAPADPNPPIISGDPDPVCGPTNEQSVVVGSTLNFGVTASDGDGDALTLNVANLPAGASMTPLLPLLKPPSMAVSSAFSWTPVIGDVGATIVNFTVRNFVGGFALCPVTIQVIPSVIPMAVDDPGFMANSGQLINIDVLANDLNLDDGVAAITTTPTSGATAMVVGTAPNLSVDYTSAPGFGGPDMFTYTITDMDGDVSNSATVTIEVDGSKSFTGPGTNSSIFRGTENPDPDIGISASGEQALTAGTSIIRCCKVLDPRVGAGNTRKDGRLAHKWIPFDIGAALSDPALADTDCADVPKPAPGEVIIKRHFGVHTDPAKTNLVPGDFRFGYCDVQTSVDWLGPIFVDSAAPNVVGYQVNCNAMSVDEQPITIALSRSLAGFTAPDMRSISGDCDPRGVARWSDWSVVVNAQHLTDKESSKTYTSKMSSTLKGLIEAMRSEGAVNGAFLDDVKGIVLAAEAQFKRGNPKPKDAQKAVKLLDDATRLALLIPTIESGNPLPPFVDPYGSSSSFANPKGDLVSHTVALSYAVCSELANPGNVLACEMQADIVAALPTLPSPSPPPSP